MDAHFGKKRSARVGIEPAKSNPACALTRRANHSATLAAERKRCYSLFEERAGDG